MHPDDERPGGAARHILVVDDDRKITDALRRGLAYQGYRVDVAHSGAEGLEQARRWAPDVVILDIQMPGMDGLEVCRRLRAGGDVPILMLTARDAVADRVVGLETGADDYLVSRSTSPNCWPACAASCGVVRPRPLPRCATPIWNWIRPDDWPSAAGASLRSPPRSTRC